MTIKNKVGSLQGKKYVIMWGYSSELRGMCSIQAEALIATRFGMDVVLVHPPGFDIDPKIVEISKRNAKESGGSFEISHDFREALDGANVVFPRSWVTSELRRVGATAFGGKSKYTIGIAIGSRNKNTSMALIDRQAIVTHVLPVFRGEEATDEAMDSPNSVIYEQAEDNFYAKMAILSLTMAEEVKF